MIKAAGRLQVGVSACLLGELVRYDGGHKRQDILINELSDYFELRPICPEVAIGLGVPRPPVRLQLFNNGLRAVGVDSPDLDITDAMLAYAKQSVPTLSGLSGYIFKSRSPSCGISDTGVHSSDGSVIKLGAGLFAAALVELYPDLPVIDESALQVPAGLADFIHRVEIFSSNKPI